MNNWFKIKEKIKTAPKAPGVYVFYEKREILYIGKASSLRNRLKSYLKSGDFKNDRLHENATDLKLIVLRSEIEALIEEAKLIKKHNPPYNVLWRDDKTYFYALFTDEKFPRISVVHKNALPTTYRILPTNFIGPFTEGRALRLVLKCCAAIFPIALAQSRTCGPASTRRSAIVSVSAAKRTLNVQLNKSKNIRKISVS